jgi:hypothetical protein
MLIAKQKQYQSKRGADPDKRVQKSQTGQNWKINIKTKNYDKSDQEENTC